MDMPPSLSPLSFCFLYATIIFLSTGCSATAHVILFFLSSMRRRFYAEKIERSHQNILQVIEDIHDSKLLEKFLDLDESTKMVTVSTCDRAWNHRSWHYERKKLCFFDTMHCHIKIRNQVRGFASLLRLFGPPLMRWNDHWVVKGEWREREELRQSCDVDQALSRSSLVTFIRSLHILLVV